MDKIPLQERIGQYDGACRYNGHGQLKGFRGQLHPAAASVSHTLRIRLRRLQQLIQDILQGVEPFVIDIQHCIDPVVPVSNRFKQPNGDEAHFDEGQNVKFSTYAVPMILGEIKRYLRDNNSVRVSRSLRDIAYKALQAKEELSKKSADEPSVDEISSYTGIAAKNITFALDAISDTVSLSDPIYNDGTETIELLDQIADTKNTDENIYENISIKDAIKVLPPREKEILLMRYYVGKTQTEVSEEIGISQAQVSRLEKNALRIIKEFLV